MTNNYSRYKKTVRNKDLSLSDLTLKGIEKGERVLGKAKNMVKLYKKHPTAFKAVGVGLIGLLIYLNRKDSTPTSNSVAAKNLT